MKTKSKLVIPVLSMHRSGSSLVARFLDSLGFMPGQLMEPAKDNPRGFFEDLAVVDLNERILHDSGVDWLTPLPWSALSASEAYVEEASQLIADRLLQTDVWAFKDPRTVRTWPVWEAALEKNNAKIAFLLPVRGPEVVAQSLAKRNRFSAEHGYALWQLHNCLAVKAVGCNPVMVLNYDHLVDDTRAVLANLYEWLVDVGALIQGPDKQAFVEQLWVLCEAKLRHQEGVSQLDVPAGIADFYGHLRASACEKENSWAGVCTSADIWLAQDARLQLVEQAAVQISGIRNAELKQRDEQISDERRQREHAQAQLSELQRYQEEHNMAEFTDLKTEYGTVSNFAHGLEAKLGEASTEAQRLRVELSESQLKQERMAETLLELQSSLAGERIAVERDKAALNALRAELRELEAKNSFNEGRLAESSQQNRRLVEHEQKLQIRLSELSGELEAVRANAERQEQLADLYLRQRDEINHERQLLEEERPHLLADSKKLEYRIAGLEQRNGELLESWSWRLMAPLRWLLDWLRAIRVLFFTPLRQMPWAFFTAMPLPMAWKDRIRVWVLPLIGYAESRRNREERAMTSAKVDEARELDKSLPQIAKACAKLLADKQRTSGNLAPRVTVIIPAYNDTDYTVRCVHSIAKASDQTACEIWVVDDCSPDGSGKKLGGLLRKLPTVKLIRNPENLGFLLSCNAAAEQVTTEFLMLLNNDTMVMDGWLDELVGTMDRLDDAALVGSKLIYPDGRLQEAGGVVWQEAAAANFGRLDDPQKPEYNYQRDVDYVSGAAILLRTERWKEVGGFSPELAPAYYEDTELAMKLRVAGYRTIYQPLSQVVHFEGVSCGTDTSTGIKRFQIINKEKFAEKWGCELNKLGPAGDLSRAAVDRGIKGRILVFDAETPKPDKDSGSITAFNIMRLLTELGYRVTFVPENLLHCGSYTIDLQRIGVEVITTPHAMNSRKFVLDHADQYDLFLFSRGPVGGLLLPEFKKRYPGKPVIFDTVDLHYLRMIRHYELDGDQALHDAAMEMKAIELRAMKQADLTLVVSQFESEFLANELGDFPHAVLPLIYDDFSREIAPYTQRRDVAFVGGYGHPPNVDAVEYLINDIWPKFREFNTGAKLHIIGSKMPESFQRYGCDDIIIVGFVDDLEDYLSNIRITVAPLRYGAGVKGKVGNSLRMGVPVVASIVAVEGMGIGDEVVVASDAADFAFQMSGLYGNADLWFELSVRGQSFAEVNFGSAAARSLLYELCGQLLNESESC